MRAQSSRILRACASSSNARARGNDYVDPPSPCDGSTAEQHDCGQSLRPTLSQQEHDLAESACSFGLIDSSCRRRACRHVSRCPCAQTDYVVVIRHRLAAVGCRGCFAWSGRAIVGRHHGLAAARAAQWSAYESALAKCAFDPRCCDIATLSAQMAARCRQVNTSMALSWFEIDPRLKLPSFAIRQPIIASAPCIARSTSSGYRFCRQGVSCPTKIDEPPFLSCRSIVAVMLTPLTFPKCQDQLAPGVCCGQAGSPGARGRSLFTGGNCVKQIPRCGVCSHHRKT